MLAGGDSSEREVSLNSSRAVASALEQTGNSVELIDTHDGSSLLTEGAADATSTNLALTQPRVPKSFQEADCVFIGLHGGTGENGKIQALLELCNIPYTGPGVLASALAMDKQRTKLMVSVRGVPMVPTLFFGNEKDANELLHSSADSLKYPIVVKPNAEGSTVGLTVVKQADQLGEAIKLAAQYDRWILIEPYIPGRELTVGLLDGRALPVVEIIPKSGLYDYHAKYTAGASEYTCPAQLSQEQQREIQHYAELSYAAVGCEGYSRADFRMTPDGEMFFMELNTLPGMTATSLVPKAARAAGIEFPDLVRRIVELGIQRFQQTRD